MGKCIKHTDVRTDLICLKDGTYYCDECAGCRSPKLHCKFRRTCAIWHMTKGAKGRHATERSSQEDW